MEGCILISCTIVKKSIPTEIQQFQTIPIFFNENIKIGDKTVLINQKNGTKFINDLTNNDGKSNINLKTTSGEKYFLTHLKSPKTVQFNGSKAELIIKF